MPANIPVSKAGEVFTFSLADIGGIIPVYFMLAPGADEQMARHTNRWASRWEHVATKYLTPTAQYTVRNHISPPIERMVKRVDRVTNPYMTGAAQGLDRRIRAGIIAGATVLSGKNSKD